MNWNIAMMSSNEWGSITTIAVAVTVIRHGVRQVPIVMGWMMTKKCWRPQFPRAR